MAMIPVIQGKYGRLEQFATKRKGELEILWALPTEHKLRLLKKLINQVMTECEEVTGEEIAGGRFMATFHVKGGHSYSLLLYPGIETTELCSQLVDEVVIPYVMDLWGQMEIIKEESLEITCKKESKLLA